MTCSDLRPVIDLLGLGLDDAVESPADLAAARAHLAACAACAARVASLADSARALSARVASAPGPSSAGAPGRAELVARMAAAAAPPPRPGGTGWLVGLVVALLAVAGWVWHTERPAPTAAEPPAELVTEPEPPAAVTSDPGTIFYASPAHPAQLEADDDRPIVPMPVLPVGK